MKRLISISLALTLVFVFSAMAVEKGATTGKAAVSEDWTPLKGNVLMGKPWKAIKEGKIFKSKDGITLKIVVPDGTYKFDLKAKKGYKLAGSQWQDVGVKRMLQRNNGKIIVIKASDFRMRLDFEEVYKPASELLGGLTQQ